MMTRYCSLAALLVLLIPLALPAEAQIFRRLGLDIDGNDQANDMAVLSNGRMVVTGKTDTGPGTPAQWFIQWLDVAGNREGNATTLVTGEFPDDQEPVEGEGLAIAPFGTDAAIVGGWMMYEGAMQYVVARTQWPGGDLAWSDALFSSEETGPLAGVAVSPQGNVYVGGTESSYGWISRLDPDGSGTLWRTQIFSDSPLGTKRLLTATADGGVAMLSPVDDRVFYLTLLDEDGGEVAQHNFQLNGFQRYDFHTLIQTTDGGFLLGGSSQVTSPASAVPLLAKLNASGSLDWAVSYFDSSADFITIRDVVETPDGNYTAVGTIDGGPLPPSGFRITASAADGSVIGSEEIKPVSWCVTPHGGGGCIKYTPRAGLRAAVFNPLTQTVRAIGFMANPDPRAGAGAADTHDIIEVEFNEGLGATFAASQQPALAGKASGTCFLSESLDLSSLASSTLTPWPLSASIDEASDDGFPLNLNTILLHRGITQTLCGGNFPQIEGTPLTLESPAVGTTVSGDVIISNEGLVDVSIGAVGPLAAPFTITDNQCTGTVLTPGDTCPITVDFSPTMPDPVSQLLDVRFDDGSLGTRVQIDGLVTQRTLTVTPDARDFGGWAVGTSAGQLFTVRSTGTAPVTLGTLSPISLPFEYQNDQCRGRVLAPSATCTFRVIFRPTALGIATDVATVNSDASGGPVDVSVSGVGAEPPVLVQPVDGGLFVPPFQVRSDIPGATTYQYGIEIDRPGTLPNLTFSQWVSLDGWSAPSYGPGVPGQFNPGDGFVEGDYRWRARVYLPEFNAFSSYTEWEDFRVAERPQLLSPFGFTTPLPIFQTTWDDPDATGPLHYKIEILDLSGTVLRTYDQRVSMAGWSQPSYQPGEQAQFITPFDEPLAVESFRWQATVIAGALERTSLPSPPFTVSTTPRFFVVATDAEADETDGSSGTFMLRSNGVLLEQIAVQFAFHTGLGLATEYQDFITDVFGHAVVFPAGTFEQPLTIIPLADGVSEGAEIVRLRVTPGTGYTTTAPAQADVTILDGPAVPHGEVGITHFSPTVGGDAGSVTMTIVGRNFAADATARLVRGGNKIPGLLTSVSPDGNSMRVAFDLLGQAQGAWTVEVVSEGQVAQQAGFTIEPTRQDGLWANFICSSFVSVGRRAPCELVLHNPANVDAVMVPVWLAGFAIDPVDPPVAPDVPDFGSWDDVSETVSMQVEDDDGTVSTVTFTPIIVPTIPAGGTLTLTFWTGGGRVRANVGYPLATRVVADPGTAKNVLTEPYRTMVSDAVAAKFGECIDQMLRLALAIVPGGGCLGAAGRFMVAAQGAAQGGLGFWSGLKLLAGAVSTVAQCAGEVVPWTRAVSIIANFVTASQKCQCFFVDLYFDVRRVGSFDPNDKLGPPGVEAERYISNHFDMGYMIRFENDPLEADAPAQEVFLEDWLDTAVFDLETFSLGTIRFGEVAVTPPPGLTTYHTTVPFTPVFEGTSYDDITVDIFATLDETTGRLLWKLTSLDPGTGELPTNPFRGFLPPNTDTVAPAGEGSVSFSVRLKDEVSSGAVIENQARIVFDLNAPIDTPVWSNTIDEVPPTSTVAGLPATSLTSFEVTWSGTDVGTNAAGVRDYTVFVSEDTGPFTVWQERVKETSGTFEGEEGKTYAFYSIARDRAGNIETGSGTAQATTMVQAGPDAHGEKETALALMEAHLNHPEKKVRDLVEKAYEHIAKSLEKGWIDATHLDEKDGKKVFDEEKKAAEDLEKLLKEKKADALVKADAIAALLHLVTADQILASVAMEEATAACADASDPKDRDKCEKELEKAQQEWDKAEEELGKEKYDKAIDHYGKAWEKAIKAMDKAAGKYSDDEAEAIVAEAAALPTTYQLDANYPNPFNPRTVIRYALPEASRVRLVVYDVLGRVVEVLVHEEQATGRYEAVFEASRLPSGVYFYRLTAGHFTQVRTMLLVK